MAYKLFLDKQQAFQCQLRLDGASFSNAKARIVVESQGVNVIFKGKINPSGLCTIPFNKHRKLLDEHSSGIMTLEIIADGVLFQPWESKFSIVPSEKPAIKLRELIEPEQDVVDLTDFLKEIKQNVNTLIESQTQMEGGFFEQLESNEVKSAEQIQVLDENIRGVTKQVQTIIPTSLKKLIHRVQTISESLTTSGNKQQEVETDSKNQFKQIQTNVGLLSRDLSSLMETADNTPDNSYQISQLSSELTDRLEVLKENVSSLSDVQNKVKDKQSQLEGDLYSQISKMQRAVDHISKQVQSLNEAQQYDAQKYFRTNELPKPGEHTLPEVEEKQHYSNILENWNPFKSDEQNGEPIKKSPLNEETVESDFSAEETPEYRGIIDKWSAFSNPALEEKNEVTD